MPVPSVASTALIAVERQVRSLCMGTQFPKEILAVSMNPGPKAGVKHAKEDHKMSSLSFEHTEANEPEHELCEHGYYEGRGCVECEYWERVDYEYARYKDK